MATRQSLLICLVDSRRFHRIRLRPPKSSISIMDLKQQFLCTSNRSIFRPTANRFYQAVAAGTFSSGSWIKRNIFTVSRDLQALFGIRVMVGVSLRRHLAGQWTFGMLKHAND